MHKPRRQPCLRFGPVAGREFDRLNPRASECLESRNAGLSKLLGGTTVAAGAQTKARKTDNAASPTRHTSEGRNTSGAATFAENREASAIVGDNCRIGLIARRSAADRSRPSSLAQSFVLMTNDADRKGFRALAVEGRTNRAVLGSPQRGAARQCGILRHLLLERQTLVRLKAVVHVGVQIRDAPSLHHLTTRKCGAVLGAAAGSGRVKAATRSRAFVSRAISVASETSRAEAASWWVKPARTTINSASLSSKGSARTAAATPISFARVLRRPVSAFSSHAGSPSSRARRRTCRR